MILGDVIPISVAELGGEPTGGTDGSLSPSISADGSVIAFTSDCVDLVSGDANGFTDVFVASVGVGGSITTILASREPGGTSANGLSEAPVVSGDGLFVAFHSKAKNIVAGDGNDAFDVFLFSMQSQTVQLVSKNSQGLQGPLALDSFNPTITSDGRFVAFESAASNFTVGDTNVTTDVFVHDTVLGTTVRVSVDTSGNQSGISKASVTPSISADGKAITFASVAAFVNDDSNGLLDVYVRAPLR